MQCPGFAEDLRTSLLRNLPLLVCLLLALNVIARNGRTDEAVDGNRFAYLDEPCDPYYVGRDFPRLTTPQWVGEPGVEAVVTLGIDDMRDPARYEKYLRPILERLKKIDGRAPVSMMSLVSASE